MWRAVLCSLGSWITCGSILSQVFRYLVNGTARPPKQNQVEKFNLESRRVIKNYYETSQEHVCLLSCEQNETRMLFNGSADIHTFYSWRKGRTRGGKMTQRNNRYRTLPEGHWAPRDTTMSFWSKSSALISEQDEKNSLAKDGLAHCKKCIRRKMPKITPLIMRFYILLSHLSSAQIVSSVQKGNTRKPIELRGREVIMRAESGLNLRPNRSHTAISVTPVKPELMPAQKLNSEPNHIAL